MSLRSHVPLLFGAFRLGGRFPFGLLAGAGMRTQKTQRKTHNKAIDGSGIRNKQERMENN
jgi:hypothetical protein